MERHAREHCEMFAVALREEAHRELISVEGSSASRQARVQEELTRARHGEEYSVGLWKTEMANARAQAATEQEVAVARCRSSAAAALDNARAHAENHCERLEEGFTRERDRAAVADLVLEDMAAQLRDEQTMVSELRDTALGMQAQVDEFVDQYAESTKRVIDRECSDVKKHEQDFVENAESLAWHEENVVSELRQELHQARLQVSHGSGLAEQQQRQLESDTVEPLLERFGTLRMKAVSDPFHERSLVCKSSMPAAPEQTYGVCGPETSVADAGVEAARWEILLPRDVSIIDEDSSEESIGDEKDRRRAVVKPIDLGRPPTGQGFQNWLAELYVNCCAASNRSWRRTMRFLKPVEKAPTHKTLEVCSRKWERFDAELAAACFRFASGVRCFARLKMYRDTLQRRGLDVSGRAAVWFVSQKYVVEAGALQQVGLSRLIGLTFSGDLGLCLDSLDKILTELVEPASSDLVSTIVVPQLREDSKTKAYHSLAVDIDTFRPSSHVSCGEID